MFLTCCMKGIAVVCTLLPGFVMECKAARLERPDVLPTNSSLGLFGQSLAIAGQQLYVGSPAYTDGSSAGLGAVVCYNAKSLNPTSLITPASAMNSWAGAALAGGKNRLIIGSPVKPGAVGYGAVYLWDPKQGTSLPVLLPEAPIDIELGQSVAAGSHYFVAGAPKASGSDNLVGRGAAYVASYKSPTFRSLLLPAHRLEAGKSVAVNNKYIAVGAPKTMRGSTPSSGEVYIYDAKTLAYLTTLQCPAEGNSAFGTALLFTNRALYVGAPNVSVFTEEPVLQSHPLVGNVYEYRLSDFSLQRTFMPPDLKLGGRFGETLVAARKYLVVGAPEFGVWPKYSTGCVHVIDLKTGREVTTLHPEDPTNDGNFGMSLAPLPGNKIAVGSRADSVVTSGKVEIFDLPK